MESDAEAAMPQKKKKDEVVSICNRSTCRADAPN
jgi:hypothetical protein